MTIEALYLLFNETKSISVPEISFLATPKQFPNFTRTPHLTHPAIHTHTEEVLFQGNAFLQSLFASVFSHSGQDLGQHVVLFLAPLPPLPAQHKKSRGKTNHKTCLNLSRRFS